MPAGGARGAADDPTANARVGVFTTAPAAPPLQIYTDDPTLVRQAVRRVMATGRATGRTARRCRRSAIAARRWSARARTPCRRRRPPAAAAWPARLEHRPGRDGAAPHARPAPDAAVLRRPGARAARHVHHHRAVRDPAVAGRDAWAQDAGAVLGGPAGVAGAGGQPAGGRRGRQPRQHHGLCHRRERPARGERHARHARRDRGGGQGAAAAALVADRLHRPADHAPGRAHRRPAEARFARRPGAARQRHRRLPGQRDQQPPRRAAAHRRRHAVPLPAHLRSEEPRLRRPVPRHRREGEAPGRGRVRPQRLSRAAQDADRAGARLRRPDDRRAGLGQAAEPVPVLEHRDELPRGEADGPVAARGAGEDRRAHLRRAPGRRHATTARPSSSRATRTPRARSCTRTASSITSPAV